MSAFLIDLNLLVCAIQVDASIVSSVLLTQSPSCLEGYTLTGRHGLLSSYEAFIPHH